MADYGDESNDSTLSRMSKRVDGDKFKAFSRGFSGKKTPEENDDEEKDKPSLLAAMKRKLLGGT